MTVAKKILSAHDRADLRGSGLNDSTIHEAGFYTESDPAEIARILEWDHAARNIVPCMVIPFFHADGTQNGFCRVKPSRPRIDSAGKKIKYEQPRNASPRALFTPLASVAIDDPSIDMVIVEGEKKAWAIYQAGFAAIGLCGIWAWQKPKTDPRELCGDLAAVRWRGRRVIVIFDTDVSRNPDVNLARAELARILTDLCDGSACL